MIRAEPSVKFQIIKEMSAKDGNMLNIEWLCEIAGVSRSGYYRWISAIPTRDAREEQDKKDFELIRTAFNYRGYDKGVRGINMRLLRGETPVIMNVKKIRRLMRKYGLCCKIRQANPYRRMMKAMRTSRVANNIVDRKFATYGPRSVLLTDITYIPIGDGNFIYLSVILDACTHQVLSYVYSLSLEVDFVLLTVNKLIKNHGKTLNTGEKTLFHSDQGCHYTCIKLIDLVKDSGLRQSMSRKGNCWDNAPQESFFGHMKDEIKKKIKDKTPDEVCQVIDDWMDYYNNERYVWVLNKLSPNEYYDWIVNGFWPLGGSAPKPPEFTAFVFQSDEVLDKEKDSDSPSLPVTSQNPESRSGRSPALPYPADG